MVKAVIFDLDGVLVDSHQVHEDASQKFLENYGKLHFSSLSSHSGKRIVDIVAEYKDIYNLPGNVDDLYQKRQQIFYGLVKENLELYPSVLSLLQKLKNRNIKIAIATSGDAFYLKIIFEKFPKLKSFIDSLVTGDDVARGKPYPDIFIKTAQKLNLQPYECVVVEDSTNGILAAKAAGMAVLAVPSIYYSDADYSSADKIFENLRDIEKAIN